MADNNTITLGAGERAVLEVVRNNAPNAPIQYNVRVFRRENGRETNSVAATVNADTTLVINGSGQGASISIPPSTSAYMPRISVRTENPPLVDGGSFILTQDSTQRVRVYATPAGTVNMNTPPARAGDDVNPQPRNPVNTALQRGAATNRRLGTNPERLQVMIYRDGRGQEQSIAVEGNGTGTGSTIEFINPNVPNAAAHFTLSGGASLDANRELLEAEQRRVRTAIINAIKEGKGPEMRSLGVGAGGMGGMGRPGELQPGVNGQPPGRRPGSNTPPVTQPAPGAAPAGPAGNLNPIIQRITNMAAPAGSPASQLMDANADFKREYEAMKAAAEALRQNPDATKMQTFDTAMDAVIARAQTMAADRTATPRMQAMARGIQAPLRDIRRDMDRLGPRPAAATQPAPGTQPATQPAQPTSPGGGGGGGRGMRSPNNASGRGGAAATLDKTLEQQQALLTDARTKSGPQVKKLLEDEAFKTKFDAAEAAMQALKADPTKDNREAFDTAMKALIDATAEKAREAAGRRDRAASSAATGLGQRLQRIQEVVDMSAATDSRTRAQSNTALPTPTEMMAAARSAVPANLQNQPTIHLDTGSSVVANGPGSSGPRQLG